MRAVIFDLDGVLVFTDRFHYMAWKKMADGMGIDFDETINNRLRGVSRRESLEIILERYKGRSLSEKEKSECMAYKNDCYTQLLKTMTPQDVATSTRETLERLKGAGYKLAVGSSSKNTKFILKQVELEGYFDAVSDGTNITHSKPDPEVFFKAADFLGETPSQCAVVEDAESGILAAKSAAMTAFGIGDAASCKLCDYTIQSLADLLDILIG